MRKHINMVAAVAIGALATVQLTGCKTHQSAVFAKSEVVSPASLTGTWTAADGRTFTIRETPGGGLRIKGPEGEHTGVLVDVAGRSIIEIPMSDPARMGDDASPVYHYGLVRVSGGDTMEHQGLNAAWLVGQQQGSSAIVAAPLASGAGTVTATDPETMRGLLKKAATDPSAWGVKETLTRTK